MLDRLKMAHGCALLGALLGVAGCSAGESGTGESADSVAAVQQRLEDAWVPWVHVNGTTETFVGSPGACSTPDSGMHILGRKSSGRYRMYMNKWRAFVPNWIELGTQTFASKPACSSLDEDPAGITPANANQQFAIIGRGTDNKLYVRTMQADRTVSIVDGGPFVDPPTLKTEWHAISSNNHNDSAAAATVAYGKLLVVSRRDDNRLYLYRNTLSSSLTSPYSATGWIPSVQVPALPSPWTAAGDPSIATSNTTDYGAIIVTRATAPGQPDALFQIYWQGAGTQSRFWDGVASENVWGAIATGAYVRSDPSVVASTWITGPWATVFMNGSATATGPTQVYQGTGISWMWGGGFQPIAQQGFTFPSAPAGIAGDSERCFEVVARNSSNNALYWSLEATSIYSCP